ncbi:hypothetical protein A2U01_0032985 [Trifolium medium]|uniref:Uncharacterized protein n=1 Tax=Trifolium medium TaxID=97028 RepID=A0A392PIG4_9FABA|nr:hypothetical protein [Trifolium medium]
MSSRPQRGAGMGKAVDTSASQEQPLKKKRLVKGGGSKTTAQRSARVPTQVFTTQATVEESVPPHLRSYNFKFITEDCEERYNKIRHFCFNLEKGFGEDVLAAVPELAQQINERGGGRN